MSAIPSSVHVFVRLGSPESAGGSTNILSSTTHAHSTTVAPIPRTSWIPALSVPPVATRSSTRRTRSPGLTTELLLGPSGESGWPRGMHIPSRLPYSTSYDADEIAFGILPGLRSMKNGFLSASASGGPRMKPRASKPPMLVMSMSLYRATYTSITSWKTAGCCRKPPMS